MHYLLPPYFYVPSFFKTKQEEKVIRQDPFPEVDTDLFTESAQTFQVLMQDAEKIIEKIANSKDFAFHVMDAAQKSEHDKVKNLINSLDISHQAEVDYNPDNIRITLLAQTQNMDCCKLIMALHW
ncbi:hypothetical protein SAMN05421676_10154 [Salinibacillus kushneri]|uniref:Uncharacterized protein n=1 Tax=Salinibacillus kushneri TaxID=237682 RepID=A0A1H9Y7E9_9BACI|nr:hypothetical protein [Salinibacillus kushneri]SES64699.1 hypothetical protein SAMN05421676_10154 [Salinibacillus kushneri]